MDCEGCGCTFAVGSQQKRTTCPLCGMAQDVGRCTRRVDRVTYVVRFSSAEHEASESLHETLEDATMRIEDLAGVCGHEPLFAVTLSIEIRGRMVKELEFPPKELQAC